MATANTNRVIELSNNVYDPSADGGVFNRNTASGGGYNVDSLSYPDNLMGEGNEYGGNYVIFYVNVHEDSFLVKGGKESTVNGSITRGQQDRKSVV